MLLLSLSRLLIKHPYWHCAEEEKPLRFRARVSKFMTVITLPYGNTSFFMCANSYIASCFDQLSAAYTIPQIKYRQGISAKTAIPVRDYKGRHRGSNIDLRLQI